MILLLLGIGALILLSKENPSTLVGAAKRAIIDSTIREWESTPRHMGCVSASAWFSKRVPGFSPRRVTRYTKKGDMYEHVVASDGKIVVDLAPYADLAANYSDGDLHWSQSSKKGKLVKI